MVASVLMATIWFDNVRNGMLERILHVSNAIPSYRETTWMSCVTKYMLLRALDAVAFLALRLFDEFMTSIDSSARASCLHLKHVAFQRQNSVVLPQTSSSHVRCEADPFPLAS